MVATDPFQYVPSKSCRCSAERVGATLFILKQPWHRPFSEAKKGVRCRGNCHIICIHLLGYSLVKNIRKSVDKLMPFWRKAGPHSDTHQIFICLSVYVIHTHMCIYIYTHLYIYIYTHICIYIYTYVCTYSAIYLHHIFTLCIQIHTFLIDYLLSYLLTHLPFYLSIEVFFYKIMLCQWYVYECNIYIYVYIHM